MRKEKDDLGQTTVPERQIVSDPHLIRTGIEVLRSTISVVESHPASPELLNDKFHRLDGALIFNPSLTDHWYAVQGSLFKDEIVKIDEHISIQFGNKATEEEFHFHPITKELYIFFSGTWTLETAPFWKAVQTMPAEINLHIHAQEPVFVLINPETCHRLNGVGGFSVIKAPARPVGVGIEGQKVLCDICPHRSSCKTYNTIASRKADKA